MSIRAAKTPSGDDAVMPKTVDRTATPLLERIPSYSFLSQGNPQAHRFVDPEPLGLAHGDHESSPRDDAVLPQYLCLLPLRGKGPSAFLISPGPLDTPCWLWQGCLNSKGYAVRGTNAGRYLVHRRVFETAVRALVDGEQAHHRCEVHRCVNPGHLEALDQLAHARAHAGNRTIAELAAVLLADRGPLSLSTIADHLGQHAASVSVSLGRAVARGELIRVGACWSCADPIAQEVAA